MTKFNLFNTARSHDASKTVILWMIISGGKTNTILLDIIIYLLDTWNTITPIEISNFWNKIEVKKVFGSQKIQKAFPYSLLYSNLINYF